MGIGLDIDFPFDIVRTNRRKTISINIRGDQVRVLAPKRLAERKILALLRKKQDLIKNKLRLNAELIPPKPKQYISGESFSYLGKEYTLELMSEGSQEVHLEDGYLRLGPKQGLSDEQRSEYVRKQILGWYRQNAEKILLQKTEHYAKILNVYPHSVSVREYTARWGSCSSDKEIRYNWRIIIAPPRIIDYVVVHELCHIIELNHSPAFWRCVESVLPEYKEHRKWMKCNSLYLSV